MTLFAGTTVLVAEVEDFKAIAINIAAGEDIGEEFNERTAHMVGWSGVTFGSLGW